MSQQVSANLGGSWRVAVGLGGSLRVSASFGGSWWFSAVLSGSQLDSVGLSGSWWFSVGSRWVLSVSARITPRQFLHTKIKLSNTFEKI